MSVRRVLADKSSRGKARKVRKKGSRGQNGWRQSKKCPQERFLEDKTSEAKQEMSARRVLADKMGGGKARKVRKRGSRGQNGCRYTKKSPQEGFKRTKRIESKQEKSAREAKE